MEHQPGSTTKIPMNKSASSASMITASSVGVTVASGHSPRHHQAPALASHAGSMGPTRLKRSSSSNPTDQFQGGCTAFTLGLRMSILSIEHRIMYLDTVLSTLLPPSTS